MHLFHANYSSNLLTYLPTYRLRLADIKMIINFIWSSACAQCTFLILSPKCVTIDGDCMIFELYQSLNARYLKCTWSILAIVPL